MNGDVGIIIALACTAWAIAAVILTGIAAIEGLWRHAIMGAVMLVTTPLWALALAHYLALVGRLMP